MSFARTPAPATDNYRTCTLQQLAQRVVAVGGGRLVNFLLVVVVAEADQRRDRLAQPGDRLGADRLLEFAVDPVGRLPTDVGRLAAALGQLQGEPPAVLR